MGMRVRLRSTFDTRGFPPQSRVVLDCLKRYGMFVADNGGDWFLSGSPDARWDDDDLDALKSVTGSHFEVVRMGTIVTEQAWGAPSAWSGHLVGSRGRE